MNSIGMGVIGCGNRLQALMKLLRKRSDRLRIVALHDPLEKSIQTTRDLFGEDLPACDSVEELVSRPDVDWVMIGSWNCLHKEQVLAAFKAGKHVYCEKPLATTLDDCLAMRDAWKAAGTLFSIGFTLRYSPHFRKIKELIAAGKVGRIVSLEFNDTLDFCHGGYIHSDWRRLRANAGTHMLEKCCHDVDLVNWMLDGRAARVASFGGLNIFRPENIGLQENLGRDSEGRPAFQTWPATGTMNPFTADKDIVDNQVVIVEFDNRVRATFHTNCSTAIPERRMYICGEEGAIRADVLTGVIEYQRLGFDSELETIDVGVKGGHGGGDSVLVESMAESMLAGKPPFTGLEDGLKAAVTCFAIDEALDTGKVVDLAPYWEKTRQAEIGETKRELGGDTL